MIGYKSLSPLKELLTLPEGERGSRQFRLEEGSNRKSSDRKGTTAITTREEELLLIIEENGLHLVRDETTLVVDSGALFHLSPNRKCFTYYRVDDHDSVRMGNEGACRIVGIGDVWLTTSTECKLLMKDVQHVPEVRLNLISAGRLDDEGYTSSIPNRVMKLSKGSLIMARAWKIITLCLMYARICWEEVNVVSDSADELWHKRSHEPERDVQTCWR